MEDYIKYWITKIAGKLRNDGLSSENFSIEKARHIIGLCVGSARLIPILNEYTDLIISEMDKMTISE